MALSGFNHNVRWNEFRLVNQRPTGGTEDAFIRVRWRYNYNRAGSQSCRVTSATVTIAVDRGSSWVVRGQESLALLQHEQGHYNITALGARDFYNQLLGLTATNCSGINTQAQQLQQLIQTQIDQVNHRYDARTDHGNNAAVQRTWNTSIRSAMQNANGTLANLP
jgi:predicted secreted Zn-dependent protease